MSVKHGNIEMGNYLDNLQISKDKDGKRIFIRRINDSLFSINSFKKCINDEIEQGKELSHPNLPNYIGIINKEGTYYVAFSFVPAIPLHKALLDTTFQINNTKDSSYIISQLIDVVSYMHQNCVHHLNINPASIYVRKDKGICLFDPLNTYIRNDISYASFNGIYSDPRLFEENNIPDDRCDIYSIGKIMEYTFNYSNASLWTRYIIRKATNPNISKRYHNIEELKKDFSKTKIADIITNALKLVAILGVFFIMYLGLKDEETTKENYEFREQTKREHAIQSAQKSQSVAEQTLATNLIDSIAPADSTSKAIIADMFKKEFKKEASKVINKLYTTDMMNATPEKFQKYSMEQFSKLDKLQKELAVKYKMSFAYSTQLSSDIIDELTQDRLKKQN